MAERKYREAQLVREKILQRRLKLLGEGHPQTATSLSNLAATLLEQGKYAEAEKYHRRALALYRKLLGEDHPLTAAAHNSLGVALQQQGKYAESERSLRQALALRPVPDADGRLPDPRTRAGMPDLYAYARLLAEHKREAPGKDVMSILLAQVDEGGGRVSDAEFENMFWLFAVAGNETLRNGLPGGLIALLQHPDQLAALRADPALLPVAVEEMLRW